MVEEDDHVMTSQTTHTADISEGTVHHILADRFKLKELCARWVPYC